MNDSKANEAAAEPPLDCRVRTMTAIEKMAAVLSEYTGTCPNDSFMEIAGVPVLDSTWEPCGGCENCCGAPGRSMDGNMSLCWQEWAEDSNAQDQADGALAPVAPGSQS